MALKLRIKFIYLGLFLIALLIAGRFFYLQVLEAPYFEAKSKKQSERKNTIIANRGEIFMEDKNGRLFPLAQNKDWFYIYAVPKEIDDSLKIGEELSSILNLDRDLILKKLADKNDPYELIKRKLSDEETKKLKDLKIKGVYLDKEYGRYYPNSELVAQTIGFLSLKDNELNGQYGLEEYYDKELSGETGKAIVPRDIFGAWISVVDKKISKNSLPGYDLILSIDPNIQTKAEEELKKVMESKKAENGSVIVMNPKDGAILAMASNPSFDPNNYQNVKDIKVFLNPATQAVYEPGSVFKTITFAAALAEGAITPETVYNDSGSVKVADRIIKNYDNRVYGQSTMTKVLEYSINTGAVFAVSKMAKEKFYEYVEKFGFGKKTNLDLFETAGNISNLKTKRDINYATASFGQGISVTPIELITAISAVANSGTMSNPRLVKKIMKPGGGFVEYKNNGGQRIIDEKTALTLNTMLALVVENGSGQAARIKGYSIAGKTGTAQIPDLEKGGYLEEFIHTFVGYAPAIDPKFIILIKLDKPQDRAASSTVVPAFKNLAEYILNYYEIPPDRL